MGGQGVVAVTAAVIAVRQSLSSGCHPASATAVSSPTSTTALVMGREWGRCLHNLFLHSKPLTDFFLPEAGDMKEIFSRRILRQ